MVDEPGDRRPAPTRSWRGRSHATWASRPPPSGSRRCARVSQACPTICTCPARSAIASRPPNGANAMAAGAAEAAPRGRAPIVAPRSTLCTITVPSARNVGERLRVPSPASAPRPSVRGATRKSWRPLPYMSKSRSPCAGAKDIGDADPGRRPGGGDGLAGDGARERGARPRWTADGAHDDPRAGRTRPPGLTASAEAAAVQRARRSSSRARRGRRRSPRTRSAPRGSRIRGRARGRRRRRAVVRAARRPRAAARLRWRPA